MGNKSSTKNQKLTQETDINNSSKNLKDQSSEKIQNITTGNMQNKNNDQNVFSTENQKEININEIKNDNIINISSQNNQKSFQKDYIIDINKPYLDKKGRRKKVPKYYKNYISTSKYTWYNFIPKILYEQFSKMSNIYFVVIAIMQCFPEISNADGKPIILMPLCVVIFVNSVKDFYEDWKRKKSDDEENNRKVEIYDFDKKQFIIKKWKNVVVGNIVKIKKNEYFPADCVLISSTDRKNHNCFIESKSLDGETFLKIKKSIPEFIEHCKDLSSFKGTLCTQFPNEFIYQFDAVFEFDNNNIKKEQNNSKIIIKNQKEEKNNKNTNLSDLISDDVNKNKEKDNTLIEKKNQNMIDDDDCYSIHTYFTNRKYTENNENENKTIIIDTNNFLLRGCSLRQTESVLCFVVYTGKNTKIMQNSPKARSKTSSLEKKMNQQIKYIFFYQILLSLIAATFSFIQIIYLEKDPAPYIYKDKNDRPFNFEKYSKLFYKILCWDNLKKIFGNKEDNFFEIIKNLFIEISPLFNLDVFLFFIIKIGTWCVLLNNLVPISLLMTLELVKYFQGWFISWDIDIYDKKKHLMTKVQTSTLNEELGQVRYIFSDKTGTLTKNYMNFKRVTIGYKNYNDILDYNQINNIIDSNDQLIEINDNNSSKNNTNINSSKNINNDINIKNLKKIYSNEKGEFDEYGKITNVFFKKDLELKKDLGIITDIEKKYLNAKFSYNHKKINSDEEDFIISEDEEKDQLELLNLFMTAISTCHSVMINEKDFETNKKLKYQASSPDELAILNFARKYKYIFLGRKDNNKIIIQKPNKEIITYKIIIQFDYSSESKSMSVIVQNIQNKNEIYLFIKGADNVILNKIDKENSLNKKLNNKINDALEKYSKEGLRILTVAYKKINIDDLIIYQKEYIKACKSNYNKKLKLEELRNKIENNLLLLGVTGIQDELQDEVYETLRDFSEAGIKLWVLTGDKKGTAKSIAYSCGLFDNENFNIFEIEEGLSKLQLENKLNELVEKFNKIIDDINEKNKNKNNKQKIKQIITPKNINKDIIINKTPKNSEKNNNEEKKIKYKFALIISSDELNILSLNYELEILFYELASKCNSVLCCRVSPIQKAKMVHLIQRFTKLQKHKGENYYKYLNKQEINNQNNKKNNSMAPIKDSMTTLAIGDGANDVNMITSAHIGVGIMGIEGKQAARASDYAIGEFKFLKKLLFFHGHESLRKNSFIICYNFYKNFLFVMPLFFVGFYSLFSGITIYDAWLYQLYNIVFTVLPIIWFGIYDTERTRMQTMNNPKFYKTLSQKLVNNYKLWEWIFYGIIQGFGVFFFSFSSNNIYSNNLTGEILDFKSSGAITYSLVIIIVNLKVFQITNIHRIFSIFFIIISIGSYYCFIYLMDKYYRLFYFGVFWRIIKNYRYYLIMVCLCIGVTCIGWGISYIQKMCYSENIKIKQKKIMYSYRQNETNEKNNKKNNKKLKNVKKKREKNSLIEQENVPKKSSKDKK